MAIYVLREARNQFLEPRLFSRVSTFPGERRYVLVEESPLVFLPGDSHLRSAVFDLEGKLLDSSELSAGWRIMLFRIRFTQVKDFGGDSRSKELSIYPWCRHGQAILRADKRQNEIDSSGREQRQITL